MEVKFKGRMYPLGKKIRKVETEAPAVRVKMLNDETKIIGMMAPKVQIMIALPNIKDFNNGLFDALMKFKEQSIMYIITSSDTAIINKTNAMFNLHKGFISNDFIEFSQKFGLSMSDEFLAKGIFIIDKEGVFKYIEIPNNVEKNFDLKLFSAALDETVNFKAKGHVHENWMGA